MSGRRRQPSSGAASCRPISSSSTCGGGSTSTCRARHKATRTAVLSGIAFGLSGILRDHLPGGGSDLQAPEPPIRSSTTQASKGCAGPSRRKISSESGRRGGGAPPNQLDLSCAGCGKGARCASTLGEIAQVDHAPAAGTGHEILRRRGVDRRGIDGCRVDRLAGRRILLLNASAKAGTCFRAINPAPSSASVAGSDCRLRLQR